MGSAVPIASVAGYNQKRYLNLGLETTNATPTVMRSTTASASTVNQLVLANNSAQLVTGTIIANVTGAGDTSAWTFSAVIKRGANAASTALVGSVTSAVVAQDAGAATWAIAITADTTNGALAVTVTGAAGVTIRWTCALESTEVTY